jgi:hypothetical protein
VAIAAAALALLVRREADRMAGDGAAVGWPAALAMALLFTGAALTKESAFVIPALAVLWVWGWRRPPAPASAAVDRPALLRRWARPLLLGAISILVLFTARRLVLGDAVGSAAMAAPGLEGLSAWQRGWVMLALGPRVLELLFWPVRLLPHYGPEVIAATGPSAAGWATLVLLGGAAAVTWTLARRGDRRPLVAVGWMTIAFLPASNLLVATGQILAERTLYGASIGAAMALAWLADRAVDTSRAFERTPRLAVRAGVACALALAALRSAAMTLEYDGTWRTNGALFQYLVAADPAGYRGHWLLALQAEQGARPDSALRELGRAYARFSGDRQLTIDYTNALLAARRPGDAARVASNLMRFADMRADSNAVGLYLSAVAQAYGADSARALARALAPSVRRGP